MSDLDKEEKKLNKMLKKLEALKIPATVEFITTCDDHNEQHIYDICVKVGKDAMIRYSVGSFFMGLQHANRYLDEFHDFVSSKDFLISWDMFTSLRKDFKRIWGQEIYVKFNYGQTYNGPFFLNCSLSLKSYNGLNELLDSINLYNGSIFECNKWLARNLNRKAKLNKGGSDEQD